VLGDSIIRNVEIKCPDIKVGCFPGIRTEQLQRVIEKRDLGNPDAVVIHVGTNDIQRTRNLDYVMGDVYDLIITKKSKFAASKIVLSGVLRRRDVTAAHWCNKRQTRVGCKYSTSDLCRPKLLGG